MKMKLVFGQKQYGVSARGVFMMLPDKQNYSSGKVILMQCNLK